MNLIEKLEKNNRKLTKLLGNFGDLAFYFVSEHDDWRRLLIQKSMLFSMSTNTRRQLL